MGNDQNDFYNLEAGDILYDSIEGIFGVLCSRRLEFRYSKIRHDDYGEEVSHLAVWKIYWGPNDFSRYTESSLFKMIDSNRLTLFKP